MTTVGGKNTYICLSSYPIWRPWKGVRGVGDLLLLFSLGFDVQVNVSHLLMYYKVSPLQCKLHLPCEHWVADLCPYELQKQEYWNPAVMVCADGQIFPLLHPFHCWHKIISWLPVATFNVIVASFSSTLNSTPLSGREKQRIKVPIRKNF